MAFVVKESTNRAVVIQGGQYTFEMALIPCEGGIPTDPDEYPAPVPVEPTINIVDPDGSTVTVAVGTRTDVGIYSYLFTCGIGAILSDSWYIQWAATIGGQYIEWREYFKVVDRTVADPKYANPNQLSSMKTEEYVLAIANRSERVFLETKVGRDYVQPLFPPTLNVYDMSEQIVETPVVSSVPGQVGVFYCDVASGTLQFKDYYYMMVWDYYLTPTEPRRTVLQTLWTAPLSLLRALPDIRGLMDKAQKPADRVQGYSDQELARYLNMGVHIFNRKPPVTGFTWSTMNGDAYPWVMTCAMLYGLKAQMLLEVDQDFEATGQTISIRWQHFSNLQSFVQQAAQEWEEQGQKIKMSFGLGHGRLLTRPSIQGYLGFMSRHVGAGSFFESLRI